MSKDAYSDLSGEDLPPPYTQDAESSLSTSVNPSSLPNSSLFSAHLTSLRSQIIAQQAASVSYQDQQDIQTLSVLVPPIESFLSSIASLRPPPALVELTLVPDNAVGSGWQLVDRDDRVRGEIRRVAKVANKDGKLAGDEKRREQYAAPAEEVEPDSFDEREFDSWGRWGDDANAGSSSSTERENLWWSDEEAARRLAGHLQPSRPTASVDRQTVRAQVAHLKEERKASRWGFRKKEEAPSQAATVTAPASSNRREEEDVSMTVKAEEVTFRKENEMGIWESTTGWGIVVRVKIRR